VTTNPDSQSMYQLAASLAREVDLRSLLTVALSGALVHPGTEVAALAAAGGGNLQLRSEHRHAFDEAGGTLTAEISFGVGIGPVEPKGREVLHIEAKFVLVYGVKTAPAPEDRAKIFEAFVAVNGVYNAWPYLREVVSSMAARLGAPPVLLPVFRPEMVGHPEPSVEAQK
jgi:hypothetical protein